MAVCSSYYEDFCNSIDIAIDEEVEKESRNGLTKSSIEKDYRECVHVQFSKFKDDVLKPRAKSKRCTLDEILPAWFNELLEKSNTYHNHTASIDNRTISSLVNGATSNSKAIHFRMMAETDEKTREKTQIINNEIFGIGQTYETPSGEPVFKEVPDVLVNLRYPSIVDLPDTYQAKRKEFITARRTLLPRKKQTLGITAAVAGAGGYGKSSLAQELCNDEGVRDKFTGGIYWLRFGMLESDATGDKAQYRGLAEAIDLMLRDQFKRADRPNVQLENNNKDIQTLIEALPEFPILIIADDIWTASQSSWMSDLPEHVSVLVTTRIQKTANQTAHQIPIEQLSDEASLDLLTHGMARMTSDQKRQLTEIAKKFNGWPLILNLANGVFKQRKGEQSAAIDRAIEKYERFLKNKDITGWDSPDPGDEYEEKRQKLVGYCIQASLDTLEEDNRPDLLLDLGVFPNDTDIPFSVIIDYWRYGIESSFSQNKSETLLDRFYDYSFFSTFDEENEIIRLHDEILTYFRRSRGSKLKQLHNKLLASFKTYCDSGWETLPKEHKYGWTHLLYHIEAQGLQNNTDDLRTNYSWLKAKLNAVGASELQRSFIPLPNRTDAHDVGRALQLSMPVLQKRPQAFSHEIFGRLGHQVSGNKLEQLIKGARSDLEFQPKLLAPHLMPLGQELVKFIGHEQKIKNVSFSPNGKLLITTSRYDSTRIWQAISGECVGTLNVHNGSPMHIVLTSDSKRILAGGYSDETYRLWDAESGNCIKEIESYVKWDKQIKLSPNGNHIFIAKKDNTIDVLDGFSGELISSFSGHSDTVNEIDISNDSKRIVTASDDGTAILWDVLSHERIRVLNNTHSKVKAAKFSNSGERIITTSSQAVGCCLWDGIDGSRITFGNNDVDIVRGARFLQNGQILSGGFHSYPFQLWDSLDGRLKNSYFQDYMKTYNSFYSADETLLFMSSADGVGRLFDVETGSITKEIEIVSEYIKHAEFSADNSRIVATFEDETVWLLHLHSAKKIKLFEGDRLYEREKGKVQSRAVFSPDNTIIVFRPTNEANIKLFDSTTGEPVNELHGHDGLITCFDFHPTASQLVTGSSDSSVRLWQLQPKNITKRQERHSDIVHQTLFSPNGNRAISLSFDTSILLWNTQKAKCLRQLESFENARLTRADFSSDSKRLVTFSIAGEDKKAHLYDGRDGTKINELDGHKMFITKAYFMPQTNNLLTMSPSGEVGIWEGYTGEAIRLPTNGPIDINRQIVPSSDGKLLFSFSDKVVDAYIFNCLDGEKICSLQDLSSPISYARFSLCSKMLFTSLKDHTVKCWNSEDGRLIRTTDLSSSPIKSMKLSPERERIFITRENGDSTLYDSELNTVMQSSFVDKKRIDKCCFSKCGKRLATFDLNSILHLWNAVDGTLINTIKLDDRPIQFMDFSQDGSVLTTMSYSSLSVQFWNGNTGDHINTFSPHETHIVGTQMVSSSNQILVASDDQNVTLWDIKHGRVGWNLKLDSTPSTMSINNSLLCIGQTNGQITFAELHD